MSRRNWMAVAGSLALLAVGVVAAGRALADDVEWEEAQYVADQARGDAVQKGEWAEYDVAAALSNRSVATTQAATYWGNMTPTARQNYQAHLDSGDGFLNTTNGAAYWITYANGQITQGDAFYAEAVDFALDFQFASAITRVGHARDKYISAYESFDFATDLAYLAYAQFDQAYYWACIWA